VGDMSLSEVAVGPGGLDVLKGHGTLALKLHSGSVPLFTGAAMQFSRGAQGTLTLDRIELSPDHKYPAVDARGALVAHADATPLNPLFELPPGTAHVEAQRFGITQAGEAFADDVRLWVESEEG